MPKIIITDGSRTRSKNIKSSFGIDPWQDETPGVWVPDKSASQLAKDSRLVPSMYSGIYARAQAMGDMPFSIYNLSSKKQIDDSVDYQNVCGFLPNPTQFFWMTEASLCTYGQCYYFRGKGVLSGKDKELKYWMPDSVVPYFDRNKGLVNLLRTVDNNRYQPEEVLIFWLPDPSIEIGPPVVYPFSSAMIAAEANGSITTWVRDYMKRGAIKAMLLAVDGLPDASERERIETWFNRFMSGVRGLGWKLFNASTVKPTIIGDGLDALKGLTVNADLRYDIHTALGTRHLLEDENFATANARERQFINFTVMPDARFIEQRLNTDMFNPAGMRLHFEPERLNSFEVLKAERAASLANLYNVFSQNVTSDVALEMAMDLTGYDLTDSQKELFLKGIAAKQKAQQTAPPEPVQPVAQPGEGLVQGGSGEKSRALVELDKWQAKVKRSGKMITWHAVDIPEDVFKAVSDGRLTFDKARERLRGGSSTPDDVLKGIQSAVNLFVNASMKHERAT